MSLSEQEAYVLRHDEELLQERALAILRPLVLTWLEAAVLLHHYCYGWRLPDVAGIVGRHRSEVYAARDSLVMKAAAALGYIPGEVERAELPMTAEERRAKVAELRRQGLEWEEIAERLGVSSNTVFADAKALREAGVELPEPARPRGYVRERRRPRKDGTFYTYWAGAVMVNGRRHYVTGRTREEVEAKLAAVLAEAEKTA